MKRACAVVAPLLLALGCSGQSSNVGPEARAGNDVFAYLGDSVQLDGSGSVDPENDALGFSWTLVTAPAASALLPGVVAVTAEHAFIADAPGEFLFSLVVDDGKRASAPDLLGVEVRVPLGAAIVPEDGQAGVAGRAPVVVFFDQPVRPWTVAQALVVEDVTDPLLPVPFLGTVALDDGDTALVFTPVSDWLDLREYRATIGDPVRSLSGALLREPVSSTFTGTDDDDIAPHVLAVSPASLSEDQPLSTVVTWLLSEPVTVVSATSSGSLAGGIAVEGHVSVSAGGMRVTFVPAVAGDPAPLDADTVHTATLSALTEDLEGNALDGDGNGGDHVSTFRTRAVPDTTPPFVVSVGPFRGASDVLVKLPIVVTFSEPVEPSTVTATSLALTSAGSPIAGAFSLALGNRVAIFTPDANLATATRFDVDVTSAVTDLSGNALAPAVSSFFVTGSTAPPSVFSTAPAFAPIDSTVTIDVIGDDFLPGATVAIAGGGVLVDNVTWLSESLLQVTFTISPAASVSSRSLTVINPDLAQGTGLNVFDVLQRPPEAFSASPAFASQNETGITVMVSGAHFQPGFDAVVSGSGVTVGSLEFVSATVVSLELSIADDALTGARNITVINPDTQSGVLLGGFLVRLPLVTDADPNPEQGETLDVTIVGNHLAPTPVVSTSVPGAVVNQVTYVSSTQLTVNMTIPYSAPLGTYDVTVTNPDQTTGTSAVLEVITAPPPTVSSIVPPRAAQGQTRDVDVTGVHFQPGAMASFGDGVTTNLTSFTSPELLVANITVDGGAMIGDRDVLVTNPVGTVTTGLGMAFFAVTGAPPTIANVSPPNATQGSVNVPVTITGANFRAGAVPAFGAGTSVNNVVVSLTQITCQVTIAADATVGFRDVTVTNVDSSVAVAVDGFQVNSSGTGPTVLSIFRPPVAGARADTATSIRQGQSNVLFQVRGTGFQSGATVQVSGTGITVSNVIFQNATRIDVHLAAACGDVIPGPRNVTVTNPIMPVGDGLNDVLEDGLTVRNGVVINELATAQTSGHGFGGILDPNHEVIELYNGSSCTFNLTNWHIDIIDTAITGYQMGANAETYSAGASRTVFPPGAFVLIDQPDSGNNSLQNDVFLSLVTAAGRDIDDVEIGDNEENDSPNDGAPTAGTDGANSGDADEMVGRCPNGNDTDIDIPDFYQQDIAGIGMAATDATSNDSQCPPCADGEDNDDDGWVDMLDAGCSDPHTDGNETGDVLTECNDDVDNGDGGGIDELDPDCASGADTSEAN